MSKTKKIVALVFAFALCITATFGATVAYLTDTDDDTNVFTVGNVEIEQYEKDRNGNEVSFDESAGTKLYPIVNDAKDANGYHTGNNYVDKIVTVKNTGTEDAYIRTYIAIPAALDDGPTTFDASKNILHWNGASASYEFGVANWGGTIKNDWYWTGDFAEGNDWPGVWDGYVTTIDNVPYNVYVATHKSIIEPDAITAPSLFGVYLDKGVDYDHENEWYTINGEKINYDLSGAVNILVISEAVQAQGFEDSNENGSPADDALNEAFGKVGTYCPFGGTDYKHFKDCN